MSQEEILSYFYKKVIFTSDKKYHEDPFRAVNFPIGEDGIMRCPNGKNFYLQYRKNVKGNKYGRKEEDDNCPLFRVVTKDAGTFHMRMAQRNHAG